MTDKDGDKETEEAKGILEETETLDTHEGSQNTVPSTSINGNELGSVLATEDFKFITTCT